MTKTYVLVHGAWHGGWCWRDVAANLRKMGCHVTTPTQTGVGERAHLLCKDITPDTFVTDIVNHIVTEELSDVTLVGHSLGGISITGAADRIPDHISHLVYLARRRHRRERSKCIQHHAPRHRRRPSKIGCGGRTGYLHADSAANSIRHSQGTLAHGLGAAPDNTACGKHLRKQT
ncbi:alpha/beta fold hydrolase [Mesorhizobium sp.]|uniref:alpha/beta fold hydrolase n=1 Tax=Mesorhizobium sp. TaxID=1871066 RepID=UPI0025BA7EAE|nr:alpha/beta fold hydrolase [Mesorhizobium sp.]